MPSQAQLRGRAARIWRRIHDVNLEVFTLSLRIVGNPANKYIQLGMARYDQALMHRAGTFSANQAEYGMRNRRIRWLVRRRRRLWQRYTITCNRLFIRKLRVFLLHPQVARVVQSELLRSEMVFWLQLNLNSGHLITHISA